MRDYLVYIDAEARQRFDAGMPVFEAARDIALDDYESWGDAERIVVNVTTLYREFGATEQLDVMQLFGEMGRLHAELKAEASHAPLPIGTARRTARRIRPWKDRRFAPRSQPSRAGRRRHG